MLLGCKAGLISLGPYNQWIGLRENLHRKPMGFYHQIDRAFRLKFSHHPIRSISGFTLPSITTTHLSYSSPVFETPATADRAVLLLYPSYSDHSDHYHSYIPAVMAIYEL